MSKKENVQGASPIPDDVEKVIADAVGPTAAEWGTLLNWPPSRGPMPAWMTAKREYLIPALLIEPTDWGPRNKDNEREPFVPLVGIPRQPPPQRYEHKTVERFGELYSEPDETKPLPPLEPEPYTVSLSHHVASMATLQPEHWDLICGAKLVMRRERGSTEKTIPIAYTESYLQDDDPLIVDLDYPLSKIARVTVYPYKTRSMGMDGEPFEGEPRMSLGYLLWSLAQAYVQVYEDHEKYGIWGHSITDLVFEELQISAGVGIVGIGS